MINDFCPYNVKNVSNGNRHLPDAVYKKRFPWFFKGNPSGSKQMRFSSVDDCGIAEIVEFHGFDGERCDRGPDIEVIGILIFLV